MVRILGHNINIGGSPEKRGGLAPTPDEEALLRDLQAEEVITGFPSIVPKGVAGRLRGIHQRTGDERFRVAGTGTGLRP